MSAQTKVALITGASRGIGAAIAQRLSHSGYAVVINYAKQAQAAEALATQLIAAGGQALAVQADVAQMEQVVSLFDQAEQAFGGIDVLVNNAGIMTLAPIAELEQQQIDQQLDINLKGSIYCLQQAANRLRNGGSVVNLSSSVVGLNLESYGVYAASKAAIESLSRIMAKEMRGRNISVNAVAPGPTATELFLKDKPEQLIERLADMNPLQRLASAEDIAAVVNFLVSPDGAWVNGQVLRANGGMV
ncbi:SDR family oxidoreductase [Agarivorans gilvus]|uniref:3-ketoacyl-ACP reductase n=1 Tax=Agarivorans gilvus TaxID=680279 RepID=A0ABQ1I4M9_9ALTE|nr:SDR family oxidoreductase [Agarivorans gilvus]GGB14790.1 3-ketoacyl-ACP reductase [Agarivorans gilvus]